MTTPSVFSAQSWAKSLAVSELVSAVSAAVFAAWQSVTKVAKFAEEMFVQPALASTKVPTLAWRTPVRTLFTMGVSRNWKMSVRRSPLESTSSSTMSERVRVPRSTASR